MILVKILVEDEDQKDAIVEWLTEGEEEGHLDFPFTCHAETFDPDQMRLF